MQFFTLNTNNTTTTHSSIHFQALPLVLLLILLADINLLTEDTDALTDPDAVAFLLFIIMIVFVTHPQIY